jgi:hypothetical protein
VVLVGSADYSANPTRLGDNMADWWTKAMDGNGLDRFAGLLK